MKGVPYNISGNFLDVQSDSTIDSPDWATAARRFVRGARSGVLSTLSASRLGYPFGSIVSFVADAAAQPVILISRLAEHSANLAADPRSSLLVQQVGDDAQALTRVTVVCDAEPLEPEQEFVERYQRHLPQSARLLGLGDFHFMTLRPTAVRYIGGFGAIRWITPNQYEPPWTVDSAAERQLLGKYRDAFVRAAANLDSSARRPTGHSVQVTGFDSDGIDFTVDGKVSRMEWPQEPASLEQLLDWLESEAR